MSELIETALRLFFRRDASAQTWTLATATPGRRMDDKTQRGVYSGQS
jgi:hypothetical protein